jgi:hypothetical protein
MSAVLCRENGGQSQLSETSLTCEQEARPTRKYSVNRQATKISRFLPISGYSSLKAVMMASDPPNCSTEGAVRSGGTLHFATGPYPEPPASNPSY